MPGNDRREPRCSVVAFETAAKSGVAICNASATEPLVMLKHFGPDNPDLTLLS